MCLWQTLNSFLAIYYKYLVDPPPPAPSSEKRETSWDYICLSFLNKNTRIL